MNELQQIEAEIEKLKEEIIVLDIKQKTSKLLQNSLYGVTNNHAFWFADTRLAESITAAGRHIIISIGNAIDDHFEKIGLGKVIIAGDTDSVYMCLDALVKKHFPVQNDKLEIVRFLDQYYKDHIKPVISDVLVEVAKQMNFLDYHQKYEFIKLNREIIADVTLFKAKKKYAARVLDKEGTILAEPWLKVTGIELVTRSVPKKIKNELKDIIEMIMDEKIDEIKQRINEVELMIYKSQPCEVFEAKPLKKLHKYIPEDKFKFVKGTPSSYKAAWAYNQLIDLLDLTSEYQRVDSGDVIHLVNLKEPNKYGIDVIGIPLNKKLPDEFDLNDRIDFNHTFEVQFFNKITSLIGVTHLQLYETPAYF